MYSTILLISIVMIAVAHSSHLPHYIKPCKRDDPELNQCAKKSAANALPYIIKGDRKFRNPPLNPMKLPLINVQTNGNLKLQLKNGVLSGLERMVIKDIQADLKNGTGLVVVASSHLNLLAEYSIEGHILIFPISGSGPMNITCLDSTFYYSFSFDLVDRNNETYIHLTDAKIKYDIGKAYYHFDNLFNGNQVLGDQINNFLNENWSQVLNDLGPSVSQTISAIVTSIIKSFVSKVPFNEMFL